MQQDSHALPRAFIWKRWHSLMGLWLVIFLLEHLLVNSQAALLFGEDGSGFIRMVNSIHELPYLSAIEMLFLGIPFFIHIVWGIAYLRTGKINSTKSDGSRPSLKEYPRNHAYTWQRITAWILVLGVVAHVIQMRFIEYPQRVGSGLKEHFLVQLAEDDGLFSVASRLNVALFEPSGKLVSGEVQDAKQPQLVQAIQALSIPPSTIIAATNSYGKASLLIVRETFKSPLMIALYSLFVLAACFHACNGLWTFLISWGITLTVRAQKRARQITTGLMVVLAFLGLAAVWGTYWINLKQ